MGAKEELDDRIKAKIKPNGEGQISGQMMQNTLLDVNATNQKMYHPRGGDKLLDLVAKGITAIKGGFENLVAKQADIECITTPEIVSPEYIDGALGQGFRYYIDENGNSVMVLDKLRVMKEATFNVLTISELRSVGGQVLFTYADAKLTAAVEKQSVWRCYYDSADGGQYFLAGDQVRCQRFKGTSGDTLKYYWRLVTAVGNEELGGKMLQWIELSKEVAEGEGVPEVGDECVGLGHRGEDRRRKNAKLISAFGETGVEEISYANIDGFSLVGKETAYQSPERWRIASQRFELVAGDGIVYPIVVERGAWSEAQAPYYYYDRVSHGGNIYLCIDKRLDGTVVEPATDQHAVWLCEVRKGDDGANGKDGIAGPQGVPGTPGKDGLPTYTWIRYADTAAGAGMSNDPTGKNYIGFAYNKTTATESNTPGDYMWSLIKGEDGAKGDTGVKGEDGSDGQTTYTWIKYADNADGTGLYDLPTTTTKYIGIATNKTTATESSLKTDYIWSQFKGDQGERGVQGLQGLQGAKGDQGIAGVKGADGVSSYFHIKYSPVQTPTAAQMTEIPSTYIGTYTDSTAADSTDPLKYKWARFEGLQGPRGDQGIPGIGQDGKTSYLHIKYSNDGGQTFTASNGETPGTWIGQCTDFNVGDPTTVGAYVWSEIKGDTGDKGDTGAAAPRLKTQFSINGTTAWHDAYAVGDAYRRESNDNGATWSVAMRMVGEKGDSGADGKKTTYTDFSYAYGLSQPTVWLDAPPSKVEGQHLWERIQKYTPKDDNSGWALASTSYAIINEFVQIGGRNLLRNTSSDWQISHGSSNYRGDISQYRGKQMLIHFEHDNTDNQAVAYYELYINDVWTKDCVFPLDNSKIGINYQQNTFIVPDNAVTVRLVTYGSYGRFKTRNMMMEAGNKPADWTAAPEDTQAEIDKATSVVYSISPSAEQVKRIVTTDASGATATSLLPSTLSVSVTRKKGNEDAVAVSPFAMKYFSNKGASAVIGAWPLDLGPIAKDWEWLDLVLYGDATYAKELARKRIHINENADISGAEIAARINASGSEVQIEGERISVIGKMISLNKMTVDVNGNATMNDVTMNNANVSGKVTASSGSIANMLEVSNNQLRSGDGMLNISQGKADATKPGLTRCDSTAGRVSIKVPGVSPNQTIKSGLIKLTNQTTGEFQFAVALQFRPTSGGSYNGMVSMGLYVNEKDAGQIAIDLVIKGSSLSAYVPVAYRLGLLNSTIEISIKFQYAFNGMIDLCFNQSDNANSPVGIYYDNRDKNIFQEFGAMHKYGNGQLYLTSLSKDPKLVDESGAEAGMVVGGHGFIVRPSGVVRLRDGREAPANCSNSAATQVSMVLTNTTDHVTCWGDGAMNITLPINPALGHTIRIYSLKNTGSVRVHPNAGSHLMINGIGATFYDIPGGGYSIILTYDGGPWLGYRAINV